MSAPAPSPPQPMPTTPMERDRQPVADDALDALVPVVYDKLKALARGKLRRAIGGESLQATGLVHEVYLRLAHDDGPRWRDPAHFFAVAVQAMRWILVDRARRQARRPAEPIGDAVEQLVQPEDRDSWDFEALDAALQKLEQRQERKARVVMLRFLAGLSVEDTAATLGISPATVKREWRFARAWLCVEMFGAPAPGEST